MLDFSHGVTYSYTHSTLTCSVRTSSIQLKKHVSTIASMSASRGGIAPRTAKHPSISQTPPPIFHGTLESAFWTGRRTLTALAGILSTEFAEIYDKPPLEVRDCSGKIMGTKMTEVKRWVFRITKRMHSTWEKLRLYLHEIQEIQFSVPS